MAARYEVHVTDPSRSHLSPSVLQNLKLKTFEVPQPGPGSVLVRMRAAAFNFRDILVLAGSPVYPISTVDGLVPLADGAGEIVKAGPNSVWKDKIGESVILVPSKDWMDGDSEAVKEDNILGAGDVPGTLSQYIVVEDKLVIRSPKNLSWEESAAMISAAGTAINVLQSIEIKKGTTVVTQGTGGVSCAVIQVCICDQIHGVASSCLWDASPIRLMPCIIVRSCPGCQSDRDILNARKTPNC